MKTCTKCGETKPLDEYHRNNRNKDGRNTRCKPCANADRAARYATPEGKARAAEYRSKKRGQILTQRAEYRSRPEVKASMAEYRAERYAHPGAKEAAAEYHATNPHIGWESRTRQRAKHYGYTPIIESFTKGDLIAKYGDACAHCGGPFESLDHYPIPISKGGHHIIENCRPSCNDCQKLSWKPEFKTNEMSK